jgi:hypothetical protein
MFNILFTSELHKNTVVRKIRSSAIKIFLKFFTLHSTLASAWLAIVIAAETDLRNVQMTDHVKQVQYE